MNTKKMILLAAIVMASLIAPTFICRTASARPIPAGSWELFPPQGTIYTTLVEPPINLDGASSWPGARGVIPVKFSLSTAPGPVVFSSFGSLPDPSFSYLKFTPDSLLTFNDLTELRADYTFATGNCHGGSLRWSVRVDVGNDGDPANDGSVFIYYGDYPNFTDCLGSNSQSGQNMIGLGDLRYDTSQVGGTFYDSYAHAQTLVGGFRVLRASLVLDSGWAGNQLLGSLANVTVDGNTFVPLSGQPTQTCSLPPAGIKVTKVSPATMAVSEVLSIQPFDNDLQFRIVDCKYMYNLDVKSLDGAGTYSIEATIGSAPAGGAAHFSLR